MEDAFPFDERRGAQDDDQTAAGPCIKKTALRDATSSTRAWTCTNSSSSSRETQKVSLHNNQVLLHKVLFTCKALLLSGLLVFGAMMWKRYVLASAAGLVLAQEDAAAGILEERQAASSNVPQYFQTQPEFLPGPTPTGPAAFLAQTNPAPFAGTTYIPNSPLETQVPISGNTDNGNIFQMQGQLSHYFPNPSGFGVSEYSLPANASIVQLNMLSRHGARYPTTGAGATVLAQKILNFTSNSPAAASGFTSGSRTFTGPLAFLNTWKNQLGAEILTPVGKQELFDSGTLHQIMYGHLYPNNGSKIYARTTTQDRMIQSAEYFMAGFFGLQWTQNASLIVAIENTTGTWNNTLAGYDNCPNSNAPVSQGGTNATREWYNIYLADAVNRLNSYGPAFNWSTTDAYNAQSLCAYETVALGYSAFCGLFNYPEWESYEYSVDINFAGNDMFQSPTGRAVGIGYVVEILARLQHHLITTPTAQINTTLDGMESTFPLNQALNFDFSHDTNIASILTAFGLTQFAQLLPADSLQRNRSLIVSHMEPFGARLDMEIIETPQPLDGNRKAGTKYNSGGTTRYIHFILNQRTIPLGASFSQCGQRDDGWCELTTFMNLQATKLQEAQYEYSCFGKYPSNAYGTINNGVPLANGASASAPAYASGTAARTTTPASSGSATTTSRAAAAATSTGSARAASGAVGGVAGSSSSRAASASATSTARPATTMSTRASSSSSSSSSARAGVVTQIG
ncbi:3-phytase A [Lecanosticta acicola]|uniref:3-phytase n=1 Tax=Lecanosticta acicola TaxID=111012 RepID=A0AAI9EAI6_9PEZI|nr:3-phytase A [Lecanosticta acicola]